jgi:ribA/ribD-fused uncharacterized protein
MKVIPEFKGEFAWLSNFYQEPLTIDRITYPSGEHAFQAMKSDDMQIRWLISQAHTSAEAKKIGRSITLVSNWHESYRYFAMELVQGAKFAPGTKLGSWLRSTGDSVLIEGNHWHDNDWGVCRCGTCKDGRNLLGWMLMRQRSWLQRV